MIFATGVLSTGLLLSGCSNNDVDTADTENAAAVENSDENASTQTAAVDTNNSTADAQTIANAKDETTTANNAINPAATPDKQPSLVTNPTQAGTPEDTVKQALDSLYYGDVKKAAGYYKVDMANFEQELAKTQSAFQQTVDGVTITDTTYNDDKTRATIIGELMLKGQTEPAPLTYELQKIAGQWKILG
ncbi:hypothetical protein M917_0461 [Psychrobacter aquaticus CMS 56]|uniref:Uncharacterized protein n=2 Tax=Psychrobacter TaxID=497 RepID=U4T9M2_9GAMM|nr:hypothetical protein M917_0461 [Psychrobacter aquaticus CMS 56]